MYIPMNLRMHRIMGKNRREPCHCGHYHTSKEVILPELTGIEYMDALVLESSYEIECLNKQPVLPYADQVLLKKARNISNKQVKWYPEKKEWITHTPSGDIVFKKVKNDRTK